MAERDHIGPDPVVWIERLVEVNKGASFTGEQKALIDNTLHSLRVTLGRTGSRS
jgi:hypothetical protein